MKKELCAMLGLSEAVTDVEMLAAVKALNAARQTDTSRVDLEAYAPRADLCAMETRALAAEKQIADLNADILKKEAEAVVDGAIKAGKITPANREEYLAFCSTNEGLEKMKNIFSRTPPVISAETQAPEGTPPASGGGAALNAEATSVYKAMGYNEEEIGKIKEGKK
jgi:phage I-like protein